MTDYLDQHPASSSTECTLSTFGDSRTFSFPVIAITRSQPFHLQLCTMPLITRHRLQQLEPVLRQFGQTHCQIDNNLCPTRNNAVDPLCLFGLHLCVHYGTSRKPGDEGPRLHSYIRGPTGGERVVHAGAPPAIDNEAGETLKLISRRLSCLRKKTRWSWKGQYSTEALSRRHSPSGNCPPTAPICRHQSTKTRPARLPKLSRGLRNQTARTLSVV